MHDIHHGHNFIYVCFTLFMQNILRILKRIKLFYKIYITDFHQNATQFVLHSAVAIQNVYIYHIFI